MAEITKEVTVPRHGKRDDTVTERDGCHGNRDEQVATNGRTDGRTLGTTPTPRRGTVSGTLRHLPAEARQLASEAYAVWRDTATKQANPYVDHSMCLLAGRMAIEATRWEDGLVILAAIRDRMDAKSSPRRIPEWARLHGSEKREQEHVERKRAEANVPIDPDVRTALSAAWKGMRARLADTSVVQCDCGTYMDDQQRGAPCPSCGRSLHPVCVKTHECAAVLAQMRAG